MRLDSDMWEEVDRKKSIKTMRILDIREHIWEKAQWEGQQEGRQEELFKVFELIFLNKH